MVFHLIVPVKVPVRKTKCAYLCELVTTGIWILQGNVRNMLLIEAETAEKKKLLLHFSELI